MVDWTGVIKEYGWLGAAPLVAEYLLHWKRKIEDKRNFKKYELMNGLRKNRANFLLFNDAESIDYIVSLEQRMIEGVSKPESMENTPIEPRFYLFKRK
jgi:hypothetical protein